MCAVQVWYKECFCSGARNVRPIEKSFAQQEKNIRGNIACKLSNKTLSLIFVDICVLKMFLIDIYVFFLFGLVK